MRVARLQSQHRLKREPGIHTGDNRDLPGWRRGKMG
jgi:hypothetical protein